MHIAERVFTDEILERISQTVRKTAGLTRCALSRLVCGWMNWQCGWTSQGVELPGLAGC